MTPEQEALLVECALIMEKAHDPFNDTGLRGSTDHIGKSKPLKAHVRGPEKRGKRADRWDCECHDYHCKCHTSHGLHKEFDVNKGYKRDYNSDYVAKMGAWKRRAGRTAPNAGSVHARVHAAGKSHNAAAKPGASAAT